MGQEFAFIFDIVVVALLAGLTFAGVKKGFAKVVLEMAATVLAVLFALAISKPVSEQIYAGFVKEPAEKFFDENAQKLGDFTGLDLSDAQSADFGKVMIDGVYADDISPDYAGTNTAVIDLSNSVVDLSQTGLEDADLSRFGIEKGADLSRVSIRAVEFTKNDIDKYGVGKLVAAHYIASCAMKNGIAEPLGDIIEELSGFLPADLVGGASSATVSTLRGIVLAMLETKQTAKEAVLNGIIEPYCTITIRTAAFIIIFILAMVILNIVIKFAGLLNKVPILGGANRFLGGVAGFCEGAAIVIIICVVTRLIVSVSGADVILFNDAAIESTFIFRHIYNMSFISF